MGIGLQSSLNKASHSLRAESAYNARRFARRSLNSGCILEAMALKDGGIQDMRLGKRHMYGCLGSNDIRLTSIEELRGTVLSFGLYL